MSLLSIIGFVLFILLLKAMKEQIMMYLPSEEFTYKNQQGEEITVPAMPANYFMIIGLSIVAIVFLTFVAFGIISLWNVGPGFVQKM
jgi:ABC-type antimicrobial peptide transport system permease subunit